MISIARFSRTKSDFAIILFKADSADGASLFRRC